MKKTYKRPEMLYEDFSVDENLALDVASGQDITDNYGEGEGEDMSWD